jgi:hypothetical protein
MTYAGIFDAEGIEGMARANYSEDGNSDNVHVNSHERELAIVRAFAPIGLDPCSNIHSTVKARVEWFGPRATWPNICEDCFGTGKLLGGVECECQFDIHAVDGLQSDWKSVLQPGEIAYVNHPYGKYCKPWVAKMNEEGDKGTESVSLTPGRFDTQWFRSARPALICWYGRRVAFVDNVLRIGMKDSAKFPSVFLYWGKRVDEFEQHFKQYGKVTT